MASIENYIPVTTGKKKRSTLGKIADGVGNSIIGGADAGLGILGMGDIINEKSYRGDNADKWDKGAGIASKVGQVAGSVALTMATGGAAAPSLVATLGGALLPKSFKNGGERLIDINGNSHELGGVPLGNDEAEGGETLFDSGQSQFIFSDSMKHPIKKKETFATMSKIIRNKYKGREFDSLANKAKEKELNNLAALQESLKPKEKVLGNKFDDGGLRFNLANALAFNPKLSKSEPFQFNNNNGLIKGNKLGENIGKQTVDFSKVKATSPEIVQDEKVSTKLKNMSALPQIIGYGAQALANLPGLFTKPERVRYDRVTPDLINLNAEREALTQDRNLSRAISRRAASGSNNIGQALNFLGASESDLSRQFGQNISKSFQTEANLNSEIKNKAAMFNAEISKAEQDANAAERDVARSTRLQALSNIGSAAALGVKDWMDTNYKLAQLNAIDTGDFFYVLDKRGNPVKKEKKYSADGTWDGKSFKN